MPSKKNTLAPALLLLAACNPGNVKPPDPTLPEHTETVRQVYVPIRADLTAHGEVAPAGPLSMADEVARRRGDQLKVCYGQLDEIARIQGTVVKITGGD